MTNHSKNIGWWVYPPSGAGIVFLGCCAIGFCACPELLMSDGLAGGVDADCV
jgi:hypothetical protein